MSDLEFEPRFINGVQGDPAVFVLLKRLGEALLFDLGSLEPLSQRELLRVKHVFVSHTHMDHFIGFDRLLRVNVPHRRLIRIWGPAPFIPRVQAKLRAYTWNLIDAEQVRFHVTELGADGHIEEALLTNTNDFHIERLPSEQTWEQLCQFADGSQVGAVRLDHKGTPSIAYRLSSPPRFRVRVERMSALQLTPGPWVGALQQLLRTNQNEAFLEVQGQRWSVADLERELIEAEAGRSLAYLTDASFDAGNLAALRQGWGHCDQLISECSFLDSDVQRAADKAHLTTRHGALFAAALGASELLSFHVSAIYGQGPEAVLEEAHAEFQRCREWDKSRLEAELQRELLRVQALLKPKPVA